MKAFKNNRVGSCTETLGEIKIVPPSLYMMELMRSLKSRNYVKGKFARSHFCSSLNSTARAYRRESFYYPVGDFSKTRRATDAKFQQTRGREHSEGRKRCKLGGHGEGCGRGDFGGHGEGRGRGDGRG